MPARRDRRGSAPAASSDPADPRDGKDRIRLGTSGRGAVAEPHRPRRGGDRRRLLSEVRDRQRLDWPQRAGGVGRPLRLRPPGLDAVVAEAAIGVLRGRRDRARRRRALPVAVGGGQLLPAVAARRDVHCDGGRHGGHGCDCCRPAVGQCRRDGDDRRICCPSPGQHRTGCASRALHIPRASQRGAAGAGVAAGMAGARAAGLCAHPGVFSGLVRPLLHERTDRQYVWRSPCCSSHSSPPFRCFAAAASEASVPSRPRSPLWRHSRSCWCCGTCCGPITDGRSPR